MEPTKSLNDRANLIESMLYDISDDIVEQCKTLSNLRDEENDEVARRTLLATIGLMRGRMKSLLGMLERIQEEEIYASKY